MKRKIIRRLLIGFLILITVWLVFAQCSMKYRINDTKAKDEFSKEGIALDTGFIKVEGFGIHYAKVGNDTLPTLFFVHGSPDGWIRYKNFMKDKDLLSKFRMIAIDRPGFGYSQFGDAKNLKDQSKLISWFVRSIKNNKPIYAIGHSYGGPVIVQLQVDNQDLVYIFLSNRVNPSRNNPVFAQLSVRGKIQDAIIEAIKNESEAVGFY